MIRELLQTALVEEGPKSWPTYDGLELDRNEFLTSSEVASCLRMAFFGKTPNRYPRKVQSTNGYAERGNAIEAWLVEKFKHLKKLGYKFEYMGKDQRSFYHADLGISGTPDGLMTTPDGKKILLEIKSIDPRFNKNNLPKKPHIWQTQQNMFLVEHCLNIKLDGAILFYIDASNVFDISEFPVSYDPDTVQRTIERANALWDATDPEQLEGEGVYNGDCDYCAFTMHCSKTVGMLKALEKAGEAAAPFFGVPGDAGETEVDAELVAKVEQFVEAWSMMKEYGDQKEEVEDEIKQAVEARGGRLQVHGWQLSTTMMAGRETVDRKAAAAAGVDLDPFVKVGAPFVMMRVKEPKE